MADYRSLFRRVRLDLGSTERDALPTDERLAAVRGGAVDPGLAALYFQYGRYLLIASSRPGTQPANLQGIWNDELNPAWESKYTININTEMNYWPAEVTNLAECHEPLFDLIEELREPGRRTARAHYGARGWVAHHNTDLWRATPPRRRRAVGAFGRWAPPGSRPTSASTTPSASDRRSCAKRLPA